MDTDTMEAEITDQLFGPIVKKLRAFVTYIRKSTLASDTFEKHAVEQDGKKLKLILDVKTRWSSLQDMLERAIVLKSAIKKTAVDLNIAEEKEIKDPEFKVTEALLSITSMM